MMETKILLIGYGYWGQIWWKTLRQACNKNPNYKIAGVVDPIFKTSVSQPGMEGLAFINLEGDSGITELIPKEFEFTHAIIATPANSHLKIYNILKEKFKLDDKNILVEKPVGTSREEAFKMRFCHHGFVWLYDDCYEIFNERKNSIGTPLLYKSIRASMGPRIRTDVSILEDYLFHDLYILLNTFDVRIWQPTTEAIFYREFDEPIKASGIDLKIDTLGYPHTAHMFSSWNWPKKERKIVLVGSMGSVIWENDNIFINRSHYEKKNKSFIDSHGNKGYELKNFPILEIEKDDKSTKSNLEKQLDNFIQSKESNTTGLLMSTWNLIDKIYKNDNK